MLATIIQKYTHISKDIPIFF